MKKILLFIPVALLTFGISTSCTKSSSGGSGSCQNITIYECYTQKPSHLPVQLQLTQMTSENGNYFEPVKVQFYIDYVDQGALFEEFFTTNGYETYSGAVGKRYSATASYVVDGDTITVVDSGLLTASSCRLEQYTCYNYDAYLNLDLRLKLDKKNK